MLELRLYVSVGIGGEVRCLHPATRHRQFPAGCNVSDPLNLQGFCNINVFNMRMCISTPDKFAVQRIFHFYVIRIISKSLHLLRCFYAGTALPDNLFMFSVAVGYCVLR